MKKLCLIIPTHNRHLCVEHYLNTQAELFGQRAIDIIVYDSSSNDLTEQITNQIVNAGHTNVKYSRYTGHINEKAIDEKVFTAAKEYCGEYDYIWFSSDGTVINIEKVFDVADKYMQNGIELIVIDTEYNLDKSLSEYTDCNDFIRDCLWRMTSLYATIASSAILSFCVKHYPVVSDKESFFWVPMSYFAVIANRPFRAMHFVVTDAMDVNINRNDSFWKLSGDALWQWGQVWFDAVMELPGIYDSNKPFVLKSHDRHTGIFSFKSLVGMQRYGGISLKKIRKNREYIPYVTDTSLLVFFLVSIFFNKVTARFSILLYRTMKRMKLRIKQLFTKTMYGGLQ